MSIKNQPHILKYSELYEYLDEDTCAAAYVDHLVIGKVTLNDKSQTVFNMPRAVIIHEKNYPYLLAALKKAQQLYTKGSQEQFTMDVEPSIGKKKPPVYQLAAIFSQAEPEADSLFQLRYKWFFEFDDLHKQRVEEGKAQEIVSAEPFKYMKKGIVINAQSLDVLLGIVAKLMYASNPQLTQAGQNTINKFLKFVTAHFKEDFEAKLSHLEELKPKDKSMLIGTVLAAMAKKDPDYRGNEFKIEDEMTFLLSHCSLVFALFNLFV